MKSCRDRGTSPLKWATVLAAFTMLFSVLALVPGTADAAAQELCFGRTATVGDPDGDGVYHGTDGFDVMIGTAASETFYGGGGRDLICGRRGNDVIYGHTGGDRLEGGQGNDTIVGGKGDDEIHGNYGDDKLYGKEGNDIIHGGAGADVLSGHYGDDELYGGEDNDLIYGSDGVDLIYGGTGDDTVNSGKDNDTIYGEDGNDKLYGRYGDDLITGGAGNDVLSGASGNDTIRGDAGNDTMYGYGGNDVIDGGSGTDTAIGGTGTDNCTAETIVTCESAAPFWKDPGAELVLTSIWRWGFTIELPEIDIVLDNTEYEVTTTRGDGVLLVDYVPWYADSYEIDTLKINFEPGDTFDIRIRAVDGNSRASSTLAIYPIVIPGLTSIESQHVESLNAAGAVIPSRGFANFCPGDSDCNTSGTHQWGEGAVCARLVSTVKQEQWVFSDNHATVTTKVCRDGSKFDTVASSSLCTDGLRFRGDDHFVAIEDSTPKSALPSNVVFADYLCNFEGTEVDLGGATTGGEDALAEGKISNSVRLNGGLFIRVRHDFRQAVDGSHFTWQRDLTSP